MDYNNIINIEEGNENALNILVNNNLEIHLVLKENGDYILDFYRPLPPNITEEELDEHDMDNDYITSITIDKERL
jgi:hypothetical protein